MDECAISEKLQGSRKISRRDFNHKLHSHPCDYLLIVMTYLYKAQVSLTYYYKVDPVQFQVSSSFVQFSLIGRTTITY